MIVLFKRRYIIVVLLLSILKTHATALDFRLAGFIPSSSLFRDIYGTISPSYQIEASWPLRHHFKVWTNVSYFNTSGESVPLHLESRLQLVPISAGFKYVYDVRNLFDIYIGAGVCYTWLEEKINCNQKNKANNVGAILKFGITKEYRCFDFSLFGDYQFQNFKVKHSNNHKVKASGFFLGGAFGVRF